jgi:hypothetical protein
MIQKADAHEIAESAARRGIQALYHYTCVGNLPSILTYGILCLSERRLRGIDVTRPDTTWGTPAKADEFADYVCIGFSRPWAMMARETDPLAVLCLNPRVLWRDGTIFSAEHTGWGHVTLASIAESHAAEHFEALFASSTDWRPSSQQTDVLAHRVVPPADFYRVYFATDDDNNAARELCKDARLPSGQLGVNSLPFATKRAVFPEFNKE